MIVKFDNVSFAYATGADSADGAAPKHATGTNSAPDKHIPGQNTAALKRILDGASFEIGEGECVALTGPNGSGKSTIAELICALMLPDSGTITVGGIQTSEAIKAKTPASLLELRGALGYALQNPDDQFVEPIVLDEVAFGPCNLSLPVPEVLERVDEALSQTGAAQLSGRNVNTLSGGEKQRIAIADALAMRPSLLILDEPSSMLDEAGRADVLEIIKRAKAQGIAILLLTHAADEVALADRVLRIESGRVVEVAPGSVVEAEGDFVVEPEEISRLRTACSARNDTGEAQSPIVSVLDVSYTYDGARNQIMAMFATSEDVTSLAAPAGDTVSLAKARSTSVSPTNSDCKVRQENRPLVTPGAPASRSATGTSRSATGTSSGAAKPVLQNISLNVNRGELLAIKGPNGSGKSTLLQLMNGLLKPTSGEVFVDGTSTATKEGANHARRIVGLCGQFPERTFFETTARDEIAFALKQKSDTQIQQAAAAVGIDERILSTSPFDLSGGEQRKVAIASILVMQPQVLVLDEPCAGLDAASHARILETLVSLKAQGTTIVLVSHDQRDIDLLADRVFALG